MPRLYIWHRHYSFGEKHRYRSASEFFQALLDDANSGHSFDFCDRMTGVTKGYERVMKALGRHYLMLPIYGYEHGGLTISTGAFGDRWDSGQLGWIVASRKEVAEWRGLKRLNKKAAESELSSMRSIIQTYDDYLQGNVYGFTLYKVDSEVAAQYTPNELNHMSFDAWEDFLTEEDSCWGFYGDDHKKNGIADHLPQEAQELLDNLDQRQVRERIQQVYA